ncbi:hypothetical protein ACLOJK_021743 [Asimina triloba]
MGSFVSKIQKEEAVRRCKERKKLMKQLLCIRREFAAAQLAYLRALKDTGVTLRQFTEVESLELETIPFGMPLPPSPPPPLPPSPPPLPPFSPDARMVSNVQKGEIPQEECIELDDDSCCPPPPPPPVHSSTWDYWERHNKKKKEEDSEQVEDDEDEDWAETNTEFEEEKERAEFSMALAILREKSPVGELLDDVSSVVSWKTKDMTDKGMVVWRSKKTLASLVKELDEYFLKASAGVKEIGLILEANDGWHHPHYFGETGKSCKSAKVFSALSWSWSSKSLHASRDAVAFHSNDDANNSGGLCTTLQKLYAQEQRLYEEIKYNAVELFLFCMAQEEAIVKCQLEMKTKLLQKLEGENQDWMKIERARSCVENLQTEIMSLQESINRTCSSILTFRDEELQPQLVDLSFGSQSDNLEHSSMGIPEFTELMQMWRTMYECHQVQNHIALQLHHLNNHPGTEPTSEFHHQATIQLEAEVNTWHNALCNLLRCQCEFVHSLNQWVRLTDCLYGNQPIVPSSGIFSFCEEWQANLERLPDKVASEAIKGFASAIHSMILQHAEEHKLQAKTGRLEKRWEKELKSLNRKEMDFDRDPNTTASSLSMNHPLVIKRAKTDAFKKRVEEEKSKYMNSVQVSGAMTLNILQTGLPNVFGAVTQFASSCAQTFELVHGRAKASSSHSDGTPC